MSSLIFCFVHFSPPGHKTLWGALIIISFALHPQIFFSLHWLKHYSIFDLFHPLAVIYPAFLPPLLGSTLFWVRPKSSNNLQSDRKKIKKKINDTRLINYWNTPSIYSVLSGFKNTRVHLRFHCYYHSHRLQIVFLFLSYPLSDPWKYKVLSKWNIN